ncbi:hypothetical protein BJ165DRAFT_1404052 [Panaeolus papilionaceus]|nr:hypothetical protein BJ165DRAFT_1404052 [Panaeolus papilionaceus]
MLVISPLVAVSLSFLQLVPSAQANSSAIQCGTLPWSHSMPLPSSGLPQNVTSTRPPGLTIPTDCGNPANVTSISVTSRPISTTVPHTTRREPTTTVRSNTTTPVPTSIIQTSTPVSITPSTTPSATVPTSSPPASAPPGSDTSLGGDDNNNTNPPPNPTGAADVLSASITGALLGSISIGMLLAHVL